MEKEEREEWEKLGGTLGYLDLEMQVSTIQIYVRRLKLRMEQTEKESHERLRMYPVIGAFIGVRGDGKEERNECITYGNNNYI